MRTDEHIVCLGFIAFIVFILYSSESRVVFFLELNFYLSCWNFIRYKITQRDLHTDNLYMQTGKRLEENKLRAKEKAADGKKIQDLQRQVSCLQLEFS